MIQFNPWLPRSKFFVAFSATVRGLTTGEALGFGVVLAVAWAFGWRLGVAISSGFGSDLKTNFLYFSGAKTRLWMSLD